MADHRNTGQADRNSGPMYDEKRKRLIRLLQQRATMPDDGGPRRPIDQENEPGIAIIGVGGRYPMAATLEQYWENLQSGRNCIREIPEDRWDWRTYYDPSTENHAKSHSKWGGFITDVDKFDPLFFNISPAEAEGMDPQERLFLETVWAVFEDAGYTRRELTRIDRKVGIFVGVMNSHYEFLAGAASARGEVTAANSSFWSTANRISYFLDLHGPSMAVDTACSSSLTAIHLACESLERGECKAAVAGGVNLILHPMHYVRLSAANMLAGSEKCKSFGEGADGFVDGEGVGAVLLKPLSRARADGDQIYAVIKGSAVNHGGKTGGYTVPNPTAQGELIKGALHRARIDPRTLSYIEAHGTGTALGDPIEITGLMRAFGGDISERQFCAIGSAKSNIGHLESAAGIAGVTKVLLQMKHGQLVPSIHADMLNSKIDFTDSYFYVQRELTEWKRPVIGETRHPRRAGISSFGAGGSNAHVILEEYESPTPRHHEEDPGPWLFVLSARNEERLRAYAGVLVEFLQASLEPPLPPAQQDASIRTELLQEISHILKVPEGDLDPEEHLIEEYGLDAIGLSNLATTLNHRYGLDLSSASLSEYPSIEALATNISRYNRQPAVETAKGQQPSQNLADIAYTLQVGREAMAERLAVLAASRERLAEKLEQFCEGRGEIEDLCRGKAKTGLAASELLVDGEEGAEFVRVIIKNRNLHKLARLWISGIDIDWRLLYGEPRPHRISLPTYPFARERHWMPEIYGSSTVKAEGRRAPSRPQWIHPLLHRNTSDLSGPRFSTTFTGREFFLADHVVNGQRILPGAAYLEMARAAIDRASGAMAEGSATLRLDSVVWIRPVAVGDRPVEVHIGLVPDDDGRVAYEIYSEPPDVDSEPIIHSRGTAVMGSVGEVPNLDLPAIQAQCHRSSLSSRQFYEAFKQMGLDYGAGHQGVESVHVGPDQVLAQLSLPASIADTEEDYVLHPSLMDSALQASIGLTLEIENTVHTVLSGERKDHKPALAFALQELEIFRNCTSSMWALIRYSGGSTVEDTVRKLDIDLCDPDGTVCVRMKELSSRAMEDTVRTGTGSKTVSRQAAMEILVGKIMLVPVWDACPAGEGQTFPSQGDRIVIVGGADDDRNRILKHYPEARVLDIDSGQSIAEVTERLRSCGAMTHMVWIAPEHTSSAPTDVSLIEAQNQGVLQVFRIVKALLRLGYDTRELGFSVITTQTQPIHRDDALNPTHASLHGLIGSMAKEHPNWKIRLVDLAAGCPWPTPQLFALPPDPLGNAWVYRGHQWYRQKLLPLHHPRVGRQTYRSKGVYVVLGGAGGLGAAWSEYMIRTYEAQIIWIGRRKKTAAIKATLDALATPGPAPLYIRADATDRQALQQAYREIKARHPQIHGIIHSAVVMSEGSLEDMDEERFKAGLAVKVDVSVNMAQVFGTEPLDFVLFFSSINAFMKAKRYGSYAAGCTFTDAFAHHLARQWPCPVKVINWGYWGSVGQIASSKVFQSWMAQQGMGSIEPQEAMEALETWLAGPVHQLAFVKTTKPLAMEGMRANPDESITIYEQTLPPSIKNLQKRTPEDGSRMAPATSDASRHMLEIEELLCRLLLGQLQGMGFFRGNRPVIADLKKQLRDLYGRWLEESIAVLARKKYLTYDEASCAVVDTRPIDLEAAWKAWAERKQAWLDDPYCQAQVRLVEATLRALPEILTGARLATDILFPNSSMEWVEGIFKYNPVADYLNDVLADTVANYVRERLGQNTSLSIRILEIGAGTGGTSAAVFPKLEPYRDHIREYCYTDVSRSFLMHAEQAFGEKVPYLTYKLLDVEAAIDEQGIRGDGYDVVIAANVLHATRDIRQTLRNAKAALHNKGLLLLNEVSRNSLLTHLTFGLLEGWWRYEDPELRIPGCPGLSPETWQEVLESEGFRSVYFPARMADDFGSQIIVAESDGVIRKKTPLDSHVSSVSKDRSHPAPHTEKVVARGDVAESGIMSHVKSVFTEKLSEVLKIDVDRIEGDAPFADSGLDSIFGVSFVQAINKALMIELETTCIFDHSSVNRLAAYVASKYKDVIAANLERAHEERYPDVSSDNRYRSSLYSHGNRLRRSKKAHESQAERKGASADSIESEAIAVIGMAGQFPDAKDVDTFWRNLIEGHDAVHELPARYLGLNLGNKTHHSWGGILEDRDCFDPLFFNISPREAASMNPHQRLILQESWKALEDAGYNPRILSNSPVGIFIGAEPAGYAHESFTGSSDAIIASRLSYYLNFHGPAMVVNTGCSSSAVAIHLACESLRNGESSTALAGGVFATLDQAALVKMAEIGMLSPTGRCRTFDASGDGTVISEGTGVVVLKRLAEALADGDHIYGVIEGTGVNQDGASNGITAPNGVAQEQLITGVYKRFGIDPEEISYVEAHGTGTQLGDPIEANALIRAFKQFTDRREYCALGSAKSHIGHTAAAAGVIGLIKILLSLRHRQIPGLIHLDKPNPHISFEGSAFYVNTEAREWRSTNGKPLMAALNSFGHSGTNVHLVVRETTNEESSSPAPMHAGIGPSRLIPLSAKNADRLRDGVGNLLGFIQHATSDEASREIDLTAMAYTLQTGREAMPERIVFLVEDILDLLSKLQSFRDGNEEMEHCWRARVRQDKERMRLFDSDAALNEAVQKWAIEGEMRKIAELWALGFAVNWELLYREPPRRLSLPTYPFARERYWKSEGDDRRENDQTQPPTSPQQPLAGTIMLAPAWDAIPMQKGPIFPSPTDRVVLVGGTTDTRRGIQHCFPHARMLDLESEDSIDAIAQKLQALGGIDHIVWIAPHHALPSMNEDMLIEAQSRGALMVFRTIKALLGVGYGARKLGWTLITIQTQAIHPKESVNPSHASLHGLIGSMAKEYPNWRIRLLDLEADCDWPIDDMFALPPDPRGNARAYRNRQWHVQRLIPFQSSRSDRKVYRPGGVYVVIGGAGGIGAAWSEYMIRTHGAQIIWIGRRQKNAAIQAALARLATMGPAPLYIEADARDHKALLRAYEEIKERYSQIHGVIHSAIVLSDKSLANMEEDSFEAGLSAKVDVCVRMAQVFHREPLDFVMFFSAAMAFVKAPGQSNYAAGCTFKDAFAHQLSREWPCVVKVMNWGYWGSVGIVASKAYRDRMAQTGIGSIEPPEAMEALEVLLSGPVHQVVLMKTNTHSVLEAMNTKQDELVATYPQDLPSLAESIRHHIPETAKPV